MSELLPARIAASARCCDEASPSSKVAPRAVWPSPAAPGDELPLHPDSELPLHPVPDSTDDATNDDTFETPIGVQGSQDPPSLLSRECDHAHAAEPIAQVAAAELDERRISIIELNKLDELDMLDELEEQSASQHETRAAAMDHAMDAVPSKQKQKKVKRSRIRGKRVLLTQVATDDDDALAAAEGSQPDPFPAMSPRDDFRCKDLDCAVVCTVLRTCLARMLARGAGS